MPAGFHQDAVASSATAVKAPAIPLARTPTPSVGCAATGAARHTKDTKDTKDTKGLNITLLP
jgi:hypothetical protein